MDLIETEKIKGKQTHGQPDDFISLLLFFKNKKIWLKWKGSRTERREKEKKGNVRRLREYV
jgi:hypothetical protein